MNFTYILVYLKFIISSYCVEGVLLDVIFYAHFATKLLFAAVFAN